jgi:hypothetical protein
MKLTDILREIEDEEGGSQSTRAKYNIALTTKSTPLSQVEDALNDLENYGKYASYAQNLNVDIQQAKAKFFGPKGGPNVKVATSKKDWNAADASWRKIKLKDIQTRVPGIDITGLEDVSYDELPKEVRDWKNFYPTLTKDALDSLIKNMTGTPNILVWDIEKDSIVFPRKENKNIPGDVTLEKVLKTVLDSAGISDYKIGRKEITDTPSDQPTTLKKTSKFTQIKVSLDSRLDAAELRKELQDKFMLPQAAYDVKETEDGFDLIIRNITISQKANIQNYLQDEGLLEGLSEDIRRMLVIAGIIK